MAAATAEIVDFAQYRARRLRPRLPRFTPFAVAMVPVCFVWWPYLPGFTWTAGE